MTAQISPSPEGDLTLDVPCWMEARTKRARRHPITLHDDWTVTTPHDLEAERVAIAMGGRCSCVDLVDKVVPALRTVVRLQLRADQPRLYRAKDGGWSVPSATDKCCNPMMLWRTAVVAASHMRGVRHVAAEYVVEERQLAALTRSVLLAHDVEDADDVPAGALRLVGSCVSSYADVRELWLSGLSPAYVEYLHSSLGLTEPADAFVYQAVSASDVDLAWMRATLAAAADRADPVWLASSYSAIDRSEPSLRGDWLRQGVARYDALTLSTSSYRPADVARLAVGLRVSTTQAAAHLASWVNAGCALDIARVVEVARVAPAGLDVVTATSLSRVKRAISHLEPGLTREDAALALLACGSPHAAHLAFVRTGTTDPFVLASAAVAEKLTTERTQQDA